MQAAVSVDCLLHSPLCSCMNAAVTVGVLVKSGHRLPDICATCCCAGDVQMKFVDAYFPFTVSTQSA